MDIRDALKEMRSVQLPGLDVTMNAWADAIEAAMREQRFGPLVPPTAGAIAVFETVVMNSPTADMRAIPNQWLLNERALTSKVAEELEAEIERLTEELMKIANPVKYLQQEAIAEGYKLDGAAAINLAADADWLSGIARAAINTEVQG